jgi:hypothetical protein
VFHRLRVPCLLSFFSCVDAVFAAPDAALVEVPVTGAAANARATGCGTARRR